MTAAELTPADRGVYDRVLAGDTVVVRLPGHYRPYPPLLAAFRAASRLTIVDRRSAWGNPWREGAHGGRDQVVAMHRTWLDSQPGWDDAYQLWNTERWASRAWVLSHVHELRGQALACHCAPRSCHGDTLARLAAGR